MIKDFMSKLTQADNSLESLNPAAFDLLIGSTSRSKRKSTNLSSLSYPPERRKLYERTLQDNQPPLYKRNIPPPIVGNGPEAQHSHLSANNPGMSFIEITESQIVASPSSGGSGKAKRPGLDKSTAKDNTGRDEVLSNQFRKNERLFSILASHSDIDHPVCSECSIMLVSSFNARLASTTRERDEYASFLKSLQQNTARSVAGSMQDDLVVMQKEETEAFNELIRLEDEKQALEAELAELEEESRKLTSRENKFWESRNTFDGNLHELEIDLISLQQKYAHDQQQLERLQRTNVYNDTFCIGHDGYFGTINGLRLGRLPNQNVEWAEINAAWGQTLLLLVTVAERLSFAFQGYRLRPLGSTSRIEKLDWSQQSPDLSRDGGERHNSATNPPPKVKQLDLFSSGDMPLGRVFNHRRFDDGMVAFLECLSQLGNFVQQTSKVPTTRAASPAGGRSNALVLPYTIEGDKIGGVSIKLGVGFSQDENFTKASTWRVPKGDENIFTRLFVLSN